MPICECCPECVTCLGDDYAECCDCFDICDADIFDNKTISKTIVPKQMLRTPSKVTQDDDPCNNITGTYTMCMSFQDSISGRCKFQMKADVEAYKSTLQLSMNYDDYCHCDIGSCNGVNYTFSGTCQDAEVTLTGGDGMHLTGTFIGGKLNLHGDSAGVSAVDFLNGEC